MPEERPLLLDLFCGLGGSSMGYHRAGFDVIGVDHLRQPHYPFPFFRGDALEFLVKVWDKLEINSRKIVAIHASPPCQKFVSLGRGLGHFRGFDHHPDYLTPTHSRFLELEIPWVIENVPGAPLHEPMTLCGSMFDLKIEEGYLQRHRLFSSNMMLMVPGPCKHDEMKNSKGEKLRAIGIYGHGKGGSGLRARTANADQARRLMGIDWGNREGITQAVPPAYTEYIGEQLLASIGQT